MGNFIVAQKLTVVCIATNRYLDFWVDLVASVNHSYQSISWVLFTDRESDIPKSLTSALEGRLRVIFQEHLPWPQPTLMRYKLIAQNAEVFETEYSMYLDADMRFLRPFDFNEFLGEMSNSDFVAVRHPGYFRPKPKLRFYFRHPSFLAKDLRLIRREGGLGTWEKRQSSTAFVPRASRRNYVCGGCWFGKTPSFINYVNQMSSMVDIDLDNGLVARFHDESHLNALVSNNPRIGIASPKFCFDPGYVQLEDIDGLILAVDKNLSSKWQR